MENPFSHGCQSQSARYRLQILDGKEKACIKYVMADANVTVTALISKWKTTQLALSNMAKDLPLFCPVAALGCFSEIALPDQAGSASGVVRTDETYYFFCWTLALILGLSQRVRQMLRKPRAQL